MSNNLKTEEVKIDRESNEEIQLKHMPEQEGVQQQQTQVGMLGNAYVLLWNSNGW